VGPIRSAPGETASPAVVKVHGGGWTSGARNDTCLLAGSDHGFDLNWGGVGTQIARVQIAAAPSEHR